METLFFKEGGLYLQGMTNDFIGNHVIGMEHGMWTPGTGGGKGAASGRVCPVHSPFGKVQGNVFHDCSRFGIYLDHQQPRNLLRDENGFVIVDEYGEQSSCHRLGVPCDYTTFWLLI